MAATSTSEPAPAEPHADVVATREPIDTVDSQHLSRSLDRADTNGAEAATVVPDAPGGPNTPTRAMATEADGQPRDALVQRG